MAPGLETYQHETQDIPVKPLDKKINGTDTSQAVEELKLEEDEKHDKVLKVFRCLIADLCQQFNGGHPGGAMSMAAIGVALFKYVMKYSPSNHQYFNRDRFVLSNGHTCLFQYTFMHLVGYPSMTLDQLKSYHSARTDSLCPGHPEIEHEGVEVTTGPLGQGVANAVGLAMATKNLQATYNRPDHELINNMTWCMIGDACLQEGVALEAIQLAGHWKLNNLCMMYDNNQITCDGTVDVVCSEDINAKMRACGWNVIDVEDGCFDIKGIVQALVQARANQDAPTFVNIRTVIGVGSQVQGNAKAHGAAYGEEDVKHIKKTFGLDPEEHFHLPKDIYDFFHEATGRGKRYEKDFADRLAAYKKAHPDSAADFHSRLQGKFLTDYKKYIPKKEDLPTKTTPARKSAGMVCNALAKNLNAFMVGTADLTPSVNMTWEGCVDFQHPGLKTGCGLTGDYSGRYIHYGIREHAMTSIANGLAAYHPHLFFPVTSSFFMFYIYAAAGVRMGALQGLHQIHIATHDSIGTGEDGPTHQPIALASLYRAMPNLLYIRPCDSEEVCGAFVAALDAHETPSIISLSRQGLTQYPDYSSRDGVTRGAYTFIEEPDADVTLIGVGSEMVFAVDARSKLAEMGIKARIVSFPCQRLFELQSRAYRDSTMQYSRRIPIVVIEAYSVTGWERYADAGYTMRSFGKSLPGPDTYKFFGFDGGKIAHKVSGLLDDVKRHGLESLRGDFRDLNGGPLVVGFVKH